VSIAPKRCTQRAATIAEIPATTLAAISQ
jgi:hypothetical protein